jgi:selenocysteine-specific elongation factor
LLDFVIGTAGHIDHGKTALVKALTGVDADRLPEEKRRGITIDLGFAELDLDGARFGFVDVPGHEKFIKNMLAGASGIDLVALVIAADEGVMPQTREHFEICRLLAVKSGLVVLTKIDLVDAETLELARLEAAELVRHSFLGDAPIIAVSAKSGAGIDELKQTLLTLARNVPARKCETVTRLPIDRAFSVRGFGAVVTGTLACGEISEGTELEILPSKKKVRVRGIQTHGKKTEKARAGQRAAINLSGVDYAEIKRGDVLTEPQTLRSTQIFDAEIEVIKTAARPIRSRQRIRVHIGTTEVLARIQIFCETNEIKPGAINFAQIRLEKPVAAAAADCFIIRSYSPAQTIAGGRVIDPSACKTRRRNFAEKIEQLKNLLKAAAANDKAAQLKIFLGAAGKLGLTRFDLQARTGWRSKILDKFLIELSEKQAIVAATENLFIERTAFENLLEKTLAAVADYHRREPLGKGFGRETLRERVFARLDAEVFRAALKTLETRGQICVEKDLVRLASHNRILSLEEQQLFDRLKKIYDAARLEVPTLEQALTAAAAETKISKDRARKIFQIFLDMGELVQVTPEFYFRQTDLLDLIAKLRDFAARENGEKIIDVARFKDLARVSRKYAIPLLEYLDRRQITRRVGDKRIIL